MEPKRGRKTAVFDTNAVKMAQQKVAQLGKTGAERISKAGAVQAMKKQIMAARARGVAWADIAAAMTESGVTVSPRSLKNEIEALGGAKPAKKKEAKQQKKLVAAPKISFASGAGFEIPPDRGDDL